MISTDEQLRVIKLLSSVDSVLMSLEMNSSISVNESIYTEINAVSKILENELLPEIDKRRKNEKK